MNPELDPAADAPEGGPELRTLDPPALRVLAHPLRSRLLSALRGCGPATATRLAERLDTNTGATSYHLRKLAAVGLVDEMADRGVGKERWWQAVHEAHTWAEGDIHDADPDTRHAVAWLREHYWREFTERSAAWERVRSSWPRAWRDNTGLSDALVQVSDSQLAELIAEVRAVLARYAVPRFPAEPPPVDARTVAVYLSALPIDVPTPGGGATR